MVSCDSRSVGGRVIFPFLPSDFAWPSPPFSTISIDVGSLKLALKNSTTFSSFIACSTFRRLKSGTGFLRGDLALLSVWTTSRSTSICWSVLAIRMKIKNLWQRLWKQGCRFPSVPTPPWNTHTSARKNTQTSLASLENTGFLLSPLFQWCFRLFPPTFPSPVLFLNEVSPTKEKGSSFSSSTSGKRAISDPRDEQAPLCF